MKPLITIVTICYNAAREIEKTICSVLSQTYENYEYVFIDGASKDHTVEIIESYRGNFEAKGVQYRVYSEPDKGIYDAMNKGILRADAEWLIMLNAGDVFVGENVLKEVFESKEYTAEVVYGNTILQEYCGNKMLYKKIPARSLGRFENGMVFCHQSVFVKTKILRQYMFDTSFNIVADYEQFLRMYKDGILFEGIDTYISVFDASGVSMARPERTLSEYAEARKKNGFNPNKKNITGLYQKLKFSLRNSVKRVFPRVFFSKMRGWYRSLEEAMRS